MSLLLRHTDGIPVNKSLAAVEHGQGHGPGARGLPARRGAVRGPAPERDALAGAAGALVALGAGAGVLAVAAWRRDLAVALVVRPLRARAAAAACGTASRPFVTGFIDTLLALFRRPRILLVARGYTVLALELDALFCLLAFRAVGVNVPVLVVLYGYTLFNLSFILPSPPGQVGSNELIGLLIFSGVFRVSRAGVGAMFLFSHPLTGLLMTCSGMACLSAMGLTLRRHDAGRLARDHGKIGAR